MISLIFFAFYIAYVVLLSIFVPIVYLIPVWIITGYPVALLFIIGFIYVNFIWMRNVKPMHKPMNDFAHSIAYFVDRFVVRIKLEVEGRENIPLDGKLTTYVNHKSLLDPVPLRELFPRPTTFTPKSEVMKWPIIGKFLGYLGALSIDRSSDRNTARGLIEAIKHARDGMNYIIFPEGGIKSREDERMVAMRPGAYKIPMKAKTDILVVSLKNMTQVHKRWPWRRTVVKATVHPVIKYDEFKDLATADIAQKVFDIVNKDFE